MSEAGLNDGETDVEGILSQIGPGDALLWRMRPYLTLTCEQSLSETQIRNQSASSSIGKIIF